MPEASSSDPKEAPIPYFTDIERAREAGRKGARRSAELRELAENDPDAFIRQKFALKRNALSQELLDAALGDGTWKDLALEKRLSALFKAMEYAVGRPTARKDSTEDDDKPEPPGLTIE